MSARVTRNYMTSVVVTVSDSSEVAALSPTTSSGKGSIDDGASIRAMGICGMYCLLSSFCVLHNKFLLSSIFPHENSLLLAQNIFTILFLMVFGSRCIKDSPIGCLRSLHIPFTLHHSVGDWVIGLCYSLNVLTGMWCLSYLSVPMFSSIKRCNIVVVWTIEVLFARSTSTWLSFPPLVVLLCGTLVMSYYDLQFSLLGYVFGAMSCVFQSVSFELGKRLVNHGKDLWSVLLINSLVSTVVQLVYMAVMGELRYLSSIVRFLFHVKSEAGGVPLFLTPLRRGDAADIAATLVPSDLAFHLLLNSLLIMLMNYSIFLNCSVNSPLAHAVTGNVKGVLTVISGIVIFSVPMRPLGGVGILVGLAGGAWFSFVKLQDHRRKQRPRQQEGSCSLPPVDETSIIKVVESVR